jgi:hypothetical protein
MQGQKTDAPPASLSPAGPAGFPPSRIAVRMEARASRAGLRVSSENMPKWGKSGVLPVFYGNYQHKCPPRRLFDMGKGWIP